MKIFIHQHKSKKALLSILFLSSISLTGCGGGSSSPSLSKQGLWERTGYGDVFKIDHNGKITNAYQFTRETCLDASSNIDSVPEIQTALDAAKLSNKNNTLVVENIDISAFKVSYQRLKKLPDTCLDNRLIKTATPQNIFKHFWHNFNDYYAFFDKRNVDWTAQYAKFQPQVHENMNDDDLFKIFALMVLPLKDGHISLESSNESFEFPSQTELKIANAFSQQNEFDDIGAFFESVYFKFNKTIDGYLDADSIKSIKTPAGEVVAKRATINHTLGYIQINGMVGVDNGNLSDDIKTVRRFMDETMSALQDTRGTIIDIRKNGGGADSISLVIASYFADHKKKVLSKNVRYWAGETETINATIEPTSGSPYLQPVVVIASEDSASAAETFLLIMKSFPQVTLIGENSHGIFSDKLEKVLPNGWDFTLSNEVFYDAEGINYEVIGVPPHESVTAFSLCDIEASKDSAIEKAIQMLSL